MAQIHLCSLIEEYLKGSTHFLLIHWRDTALYSGLMNYVTKNVRSLYKKGTLSMEVDMQNKPKTEFSISSLISILSAAVC